MKSSLSIWRYVVNVKYMIKISSIFVVFLGNINFINKAIKDYKISISRVIFSI